MRRSAILTAIGAAVTLMLPSQAFPHPGVAGAVGIVAQQTVKAGLVPGIVIAVVDGDAPPIIQAYGLANLASGAPVDKHTRFEIGSITKQFTAAAVLQLAAAGKLSLRDRLGGYVPEYAAGRDVSIEQLLHQVSGIPDYTNGADFDRIAATRRGSFDAMLARIATKPLNFVPGTHWEYSNTNYVLLGKIVERVSKMSWEQYIRTRVFARAGMTSSGFMDDERTLPDMATGYETRNGKVVRASSAGGWAGAAGAIVSTATDMLKWDDALFAGKVVSRRDLALMTAPGRLSNGQPTSYGFGLDIERQNGQVVFEHEGGTPGFGALSAVYPGLHEAIVVLGNNSHASLIGARLFAALHPALASAVVPAPGENLTITARAKEWWNRFATGDIDRRQLSPSLGKSLTPELAAQLKGHLAQLGRPTAWRYRGHASALRGATWYDYTVTCKSGASVPFSLALTSSGTITSFKFD